MLLRALFAVLFYLSLTLAPVQAANTGVTLPSEETVRANLAAIDTKKLPEAEQKQLQETLQSTLKHLLSLQDSDAQLTKLRQQLAQAPQQTTQAQRELASLQQQNKSDTQLQRYRNQDSARLEKLLVSRQQQLSDWQEDLLETSAALTEAQTRPERAQREISANQARTQAIRDLLKAGRDKSGPFSPEQQEMLHSELAALEASSLLRREELAGNSILQELATSQRDLLTKRIADLEAEVLSLQTVLNEKRRAESAETVAQAERNNQEAARSNLLARQADANRTLSNQLLRSTERANVLVRKNLETRQQVDALKQASQTLDEQIDVLRGSLLLTRILYQQKNALPRVDVDNNLANEIGDLRLYQFELNQQRAEIANPDAYINRLLTEHPEEQAQRNDLMELVRARLELIDHLNTELGNLLTQAITLQLNQKQLLDRSASLSRTLDEQMFWIASNKPLDLDWLHDMPGRLKRQFDALPIANSTHAIGAGLIGQPLFFLPLVLVLGVLLKSRGWLRQRLVLLAQEASNPNNDNQTSTPLALLCHFLLVLPVPLIVAACGLVLVQNAQAGAVVFGESLLTLAQAMLVFGVSYRLLAKDGVAEQHFGWPSERVQMLHRQIRRLGLVVMPMVLVVGIAERQLSGISDDVLGIFIVLVGFLLMSVILLRIMQRLPIIAGSRILHFLVGVLLVGLPLAHVVLVGFGYYYTALKLTGRLFDTLYIIAIWVTVYATVLRGWSLAARRLAFKREQRQHLSLRENMDGAEIIEEPTLALEQINAQSIRLIRLGLFLGFCGLLYLVWADLLAVFTYLDSVTLYEYNAGTADKTSIVPISLGDFIGALVILGVTFVMARNLPGLLEMLVLSRLQLAQGSAYATTTLLSYTIIGAGLVTTLSTLGLSWGKLQWLVAALSVGIGFGMQEIFANFISGLILLFERPIRIGDVVTIGNLSGSVSKIRIRATTIVDFDRKEIIVPNKTFITSQLVNWSLSDTITRVTLRLGVAYGSDLDLVKRLLLQIARDNVRVLSEPEPQVYFLTFGESTLDHELRIHVRELSDRNPAIDEINRDINRQFQAHGIEIAYRQLDVMIKNISGQELHMVKQKPLNNAPRISDEEAASRG